ncbi:MAG: S-methyl-5-thioribose kinase, partial [Clostridia bacterium]|nr:S-methyl-5-thioribose kinase [Clostridia bacterium]
MAPKMIDMEYTFCGPMSYDLGYLACHILSQYVCTVFRAYPEPGRREEYRRYCLECLAGVFEEYCRVFFQCWDEDVKDIYQGVPGF